MTSRAKIFWGCVSAAVVAISALAWIFHDNEGAITGLNIFGVVGAAAGASFAAYLSFQSAQASSDTARQVRLANLRHSRPVASYYFAPNDEPGGFIPYENGSTFKVLITVDPAKAIRNVVVRWRPNSGPAGSRLLREDTEWVALTGITVTGHHEIRPLETVPIASFRSITVEGERDGALWVAEVPGTDPKFGQLHFEPKL